MSTMHSTALVSAEPAKRGRWRFWFWTGFFGVLLIGIAISVFALIRGSMTWFDEQIALRDTGMASDVTPVLTEAIRVTLAPGESVMVDTQALAATRRQALAELDARIERSEASLTGSLDIGLERVFAGAEARIPEFADWYYSLPGEYTRLIKAAFGNLGEFMVERLNTMVFEPAGTAEAFDALTVELGKQALSEVTGAATNVRDLIFELMRENALAANDVQVQDEWDLGTRIGEGIAPVVDLTVDDIARQGAALSAGGVVAAATVKKIGASAVASATAKMSAKPAAGALGSLLAKLGIKSAAKVGTAAGAAGTGAATGAAICAGTVLGAPLSPACALVGGTVTGVTTWFVVDKAVIEADELLHRDEFEAQLRDALAEQREGLRTELRIRYIDGVEAVLTELRADIEERLATRDVEPRRDFVPAKAGSVID